MTLFVALAALGLGVTLVTGVTLAFNILVLALFTVLWIAFAMALVFSPRTLDDIWHSFRGLPLIVQVLLVFLLLPIAIGLWIWERSWSLPTRLVLIVALGIGNILMFFPQTAGAS